MQTPCNTCKHLIIKRQDNETFSRRFIECSDKKREKENFKYNHFSYNHTCSGHEIAIKCKDCNNFNKRTNYCSSAYVCEKE